MTGSLGDVRAVLAAVAEQLSSAQQHTGLARERIIDAVRVLDALGEHHSRPLVPRELHLAAEKVERSLDMINAGAMAVADLDARL